MDALLITSRAVHFAAAISLFGAFVFDCFIAVPALRRAGVGLAAPRRRSRLLASASLAFLTVSGMGWLAAIAGDMSGKPLAAVLSGGTLSIVLTETRFGEDWLLRLGAVVMLGALQVATPYLPPRTAAALRWAELAVGLFVLASLAWAGHGAATAGEAGDLHLAGDVLHLIAAGTWLGTLPPLALLIAAARRSGDPPGAAVIRAATGRYSILAIASVAILVASGLVNTWFLAGSAPALIGTRYGRLLLGKIALFLGMLVIAAINLLRLAPRVAGGDGAQATRATDGLRRNAVVETLLGLGVLAIVGMLGILPPGLHEQPGWPLPFRLDFAGLTAGEKVLLGILAALLCGCGGALVAAGASGRHRWTAAAALGLALCGAAAAMLLAPVVEPAYPTSYYAPAEPYAAASVVRGAAVYAANCVACHGASGRGDGPAAAGLPVRPANLTEAHLFAHSPGDLFWWISHGRADGAMPGFAAVLAPNQRWDVINFIRARAAGDLALEIGGQISAAPAYPVPDFAFINAGGQDTLRRTLERGPVLLVLYASPAPLARLRDLVAAEPRLAAVGLRILAVDLGEPRAGGDAARPPLVLDASGAVRTTLALFGEREDGGITELLLDRNGDVRARWTARGAGGLPDVATLAADAVRTARFAVAAPSHAGHAE